MVARPAVVNAEVVGLHTFVTAGPMFRRPIAVRAGEIVEREGFFADLLPA